MDGHGYDALRLDGRVVLVTGGATGIGRATAHVLARRGALVMVADRDEAGAAQVVDTIVGEGGSAAHTAVDIADEDAVRAMVRHTLHTFGGLDAAVNNAGVAPPPAPLVDLSLEDWNRTIGINLTGTFLCLKHEIPPMVERGRGSIVNLSSRSGVVGTPHLPSYVASKHGILGLTRAAAVDHSRHGVRVNAVLPGVIETQMSAASLADPVLAASRADAHPIGRFGQPAEVAELIAWLVSDASSFVSGSPHFVDGGANGA